MIVIGILVVVGSVAGYSFVSIGHGFTSGTTTDSMPTGNVSTLVVTYTITSGTHTTTSFVTTTVHETATDTQTRTSTVIVNATSNTTATVKNTSTVTNTATTTGSSQTSTSVSSGSTQNSPSVVDVSGLVSTTGIATEGSSITFSDATSTYSSDITNGAFSIALPNDESYGVSVSWKGEYVWQFGAVREQLQLFQNRPFLTINWRLQTPDSEVNMSGNLSPTGLDTQATQIFFSGVHGSYIGTVASGKYSLLLPNQASYAVSAAWRGLYPWQTGVTNLGSIFVNASSSLVSNWNLNTPNSLVTVSGNLTASGIGTQASSLIFVDSNVSLHYDTSVVDGHYSVTLPNMAEYMVSVGWTGGFTWQTGNVSAGDFSLYQNAAAVSKNWEVQIPDSEVEVSGSVLTSGGGTHAMKILFSGLSGTFSATVINGEYSIVLPNTVSYEATIFWSGSYSWQNGSIQYQLPVYAGSGSNSFSASWLVPTPNSTVTVAGKVTTQSGYAPTGIKFVSTNGTVVAASNIVNNQYSVILPDAMNFTVVISVDGSYAPINDGVFELAAPPGSTQIIANWIV